MTKKAQLSYTIELPHNYRANDILAFHQRDAQAVAERVEPRSLVKGILWNNQPTCLSIDFQSTHAQATLQIDGSLSSGDADLFSQHIQRMLGLTQAIEEFEQRFGNDPQLGKVLQKQANLRIPTTFSFFEAISWGIIGQQISVSAAVAVRRKLICYLNQSHSSGLLCYPNAQSISQLNEEDLRTCGFSQNKARSLLAVTQAIQSGDLHCTDEFTHQSIDTLSKQLEAIRGIGPWTVNYVLIRGLGWLDASLHGDIAVRRGLQNLLQSSDKISEKQTQQWLEQFAPWRSLVAAHLWAYG
ncbi:MAG: AlkA N-terminal domain-containing protein [Nitrosomonas sp.]